MCRALTVLCLATDEDALGALKRATVSADWELAPGATTEEEATRQLHERRPQVLVAFGDFGPFVARALEAYPYLRVVADRELAGASAIASSLEEVRDAIRGRGRPGGPVR